MLKQILKVSLMCSLLTVGLLASTHLARADTFTLTYTDTIALQRTDWAETMTFPRFDPAQGVLIAIDFKLEGGLEGSAKFESLDSENATITVGMAAQVDLQRPDGSLITKANPEAAVTAEITSFDGAIDYAGGSGRTFERLIGLDIAETDLFTTPTDLLLFTGLGVIDLPVRASGASRGEGAGNLALSYRTTASALVHVTYIYTAPAIVLKKYTNGEDADETPGPLIENGQPVTWTYVITNTGSVALVEINVIDDQEGAVLTCPSTTLAAGASMTCTLTGVAAAGQYTNTATVTGKTPPDGVNPPRTVTDSDPSHYYGTAIPSCPVDERGVTELPRVEYLGEGNANATVKTFVLPPDYELFLVKRRVRGAVTFFEFQQERGEVDGDGQTVYRSPGGLRHPERVWACAGDCQFVPHVDGLEPIGLLEPGITVGAVVIDDDNDNRLNFWVANGDVNNPIQTITDQVMTEYITLEIPFAAEWGFYAADSIGIVDICLAPNGRLDAPPNGNGQAAAQAAPSPENEPNQANRRLYLPVIARAE